MGIRVAIIIYESECQKGNESKIKNKVENKKVFQEIGLYDLKYKNMADYEFLLRYFKNKQNKKIIFIEKPLCKFALHGLSDSNYLANLKEIELISKKYYSVTLFILAPIFLNFSSIFS